MLAKAAIIQGTKELVSQVADVKDEDDLNELVKSVYGAAREQGLDLWSHTLQVTRAGDAARS